MSDAFPYFVIFGSDDGDVRISNLTKDELETRLNENYWGGAKIRSEIDDEDLRELNGVVIIRGDMVIPFGERSVTRWKVP